MQDVIKKLRDSGELIEFEEELDINLEIPHIAYIEVKKENGGKAILFHNPINREKEIKYSIPVLMNLFGSYKRVEMFIGDVEAIAKEIEELMHFKMPEGFFNKIASLTKLFSLKTVFPKKLNKNSEAFAMSYNSLFELPILKTWDLDGGAFITMGQVYTQDVEGKLFNLGMYRLQVFGDKKLGLHWQIHKDSNHFFHQYKKAKLKMPVTIAIGGDPLYTWCGTAPLPLGVNELMLYGFIKNRPAKVVKSKTNPLYFPDDVDFVIEGYVDCEKLEIEGPFGDHTGYYTLKEPYPVLEVSSITSKENPIYLATVVGKPPLEDKYLGYATERIFLPLLKTNAPNLIDYHMPENGVFHNLILAKIAPLYPAHARQIMHTFWGVGQMSFVKHAIFVDENGPDLKNYDEIVDYILNRVSIDRLLITDGICDALDHSSPKPNQGGKLGIDCCGDEIEEILKDFLSDEKLLNLANKITHEVIEIKQYKLNTKNPITVMAVDKIRNQKELFELLKPLHNHLRILVFVDSLSNYLENPYMLIWRVVNNIDAKRDIYIENEVIAIDGTAKNSLDNFSREWPDDVVCNRDVLNSLMSRKIIDIDENFIKKLAL